MVSGIAPVRETADEEEPCRGGARGSLDLALTLDSAWTGQTCAQLALEHPRQPADPPAMDDNPWGAPSAPSSPHLDPTSRSLQLEQEPRLSLEIDDNDDLAPTWGNDSPGDAAAARLPAVAPLTEDEGQGAPAAVRERDEEPAGTSSDEPAEGAPDVPAPAEPTSPSPPPAHAAWPEPASPPPAPRNPPAPTTSLPTLSFDDSLLDEGPPMDDFSDVDDPVLASTAADDFGAPAGGADDFDDFGSVGEAGDDDFGDFGDFGDAAPLDEAAFDAPAPAAPPPAPAFAPAPAPVSAYPPLRLDLSNTSRRAVAPQLRDFFAEAWPASLQAVNDDPERQVEGPAQVLVTDSACVTSPLLISRSRERESPSLMRSSNLLLVRSRKLLTTLSTVPPLKPLDWRRSRIRREHLISMGIPVNLDEVRCELPFPVTLAQTFFAFSRLVG